MCEIRTRQQVSHLHVGLVVVVMMTMMMMMVVLMMTMMMMVVVMMMIPMKGNSVSNCDFY